MTDIDAFADNLLLRMLQHAPDLAAEMGIGAVAGAALDAAALPDFSDKGIAARRAVMADAHARFARYAPPGAPEAALTHKVLEYLLSRGLFGPYAGVEAHAFPEAPYPLNHLNGAQTTLLMLLTRDQDWSAPNAGETFRARLDAVPAAIDGALQAFDARMNEGFSPPAHGLRRTLKSLEAVLDCAENPILTAASAHAPASGAQWRVAVTDALAQRVIPAFARLRDAVAAASHALTRDDGLWATPDGDAHYAWLLGAHTTTDYTPEQVHALGIEETERVKERLHQEFDALKLPKGTLSERFVAYNASGRERFSHDREDVLRDASALMRRYEVSSRRLFRLWPSASFDITPLPPAFEGVLHHHYTPPSVDGGRRGRISLDTTALIGAPKAPLAVLSAHEAAPGHHTQLALVQELSGLCALRRAVTFNAYIEGWAKYAELLLERELDDDPHVRIARLQGELFSSVNLGLDTGVHALRWTREKAIRHFMEQAGVEEPFAAAIVDRSLATPGQLCSYKIGMLRVLELSDRFREAGADIRDFHDAYLRHGALPLNLLSEAVTLPPEGPTSQ